MHQEMTPAYVTPAEREVWLEPLRDKAFWFALIILYATGMLLAGSPRAFREPSQHVWFAMASFFLIGLVILLRLWQRLIATVVLVAGCALISLAAATWGAVDEALWLLVVPAGAAHLIFGPIWGAATAAAGSLIVIATPTPLLPAGSPARSTAVIGMWATVGLLDVAVRSLLSPLQWAWSSYEHNRLVLEQARENQVKLYQTAEDLEAANLQLNRLNRLAQALRQTAEDERSAKERFVANVSHELRTPLNMIIGFCEMITNAPEAYGTGVPPALLADLNVVLRNSQHLSSLIDDVLDLSQIEVGQMALTKERTSLNEIIQSATIAVRPLLETKGLSLRVDIPEDLPLISCDRTRIREVILNLLSNAGRFTEQGGIEIEARQEDKHVIIRVTDTGPGIADEKKARLFMPFEQLDGSIRRRYGGTGLGLSISKSFVELHDGEMWVESVVGQGTTFFISLPIDPPPPLESSVLRWFNPYESYEDRDHPTYAPTASLQPRVVLMEHGDAMQRLLDRYLDGIDMVPTSTLEAALQELAQTPSQVLLVNALHVGETLQRLRSTKALPYGVPAIICSIPGTGQASDALGVFDYLVKPISRQALFACLDRLPEPATKILLVDDEPDALQLFGRMLSEGGQGYQVIRASNGAQALDLLRQEHPDVMLLDLVMPEMDGFQLLAVKSKEPELQSIPVVLISARDPLGQPILSNSLAVTCHRGMSAREILSAIDALSRILSRASAPADRGLTTTSLD